MNFVARLSLLLLPAFMVTVLAACGSHRQLLNAPAIDAPPSSEAIGQAQVYILKSLASSGYVVVDPAGGIDAHSRYPIEDSKIQLVVSAEPNQFYLQSLPNQGVYIYINDERKIKAGHFGYGDHSLFTVQNVERGKNTYWRLHSVRYPEAAIGFNEQGQLRNYQWEQNDDKQTLFVATALGE